MPTTTQTTISVQMNRCEPLITKWLRGAASTASRPTRQPPPPQVHSSSTPNRRREQLLAGWKQRAIGTARGQQQRPPTPTSASNCSRGASGEQQGGRRP
ncbi:hypothetical protein L208DRAFT_574717 [Tricholoma matsutake]|nr:hypothetical protein L208DRAFT_574717 [Tricholoma matsutake 945]